MSKATKSSYSYTPFGELISGTNARTTFYAYNGESYDSATGMVNLRARWYEPATMRFSQRDIWHGAQTISTTQIRYLYCINDPINLYDFNGKAITSRFAGPRLPISKPLVDITKDNPGLKKSVVDSISKLSALIDTGIDTTGYNDAQKKVVEEAERKLLEEILNGTLTEEKRKSIIHSACYESFWAGGDDYFSGNWWQDKTKRDEAYQMLLLEAQSTGSLNLIAIDQENASGEINNKMLGFQAIINAARTGVWDVGTLSAIENGLVAEGIAGSYIVTPDQLATLYGREIIGRETGYWLESSGLSDAIYNASLLSIMMLRSIEVDSSYSKAGQSTGNTTTVKQGDSSGQRADFYVKPNGEVVPATGYRYMPRNAGYIDALDDTMVIPANTNGTYVSFDKYDIPQPGLLQVPHDASIRGSFDTLQLMDDIRIPYGKWGTADWLEPIVTDYPQFGSGGATQAITNQNIILNDLVDLLKH